MLRRCALSCIALAFASCDGGEPAPKPQPAADAPPAAEDAAAARRKAEREKKAAEEAEAQKAKDAAIDALAVLPDKLPKSLAKACDQLVDAYDAYMRSVLTGDLKTKWVTGGNEMQLQVQRAECNKRSIQVAACETRALGAMTPEQEKDMGAIFGRCVAKFGGP